jgi:hypothetical protein
MMIHNRSKRAQYFTEQKAKHQAAVYNARLAIQHGTATEAEIDFIMREDIEEARLKELTEKRTQKKGVLKTVKEWMFSGLENEETGDHARESETRQKPDAYGEKDDRKSAVKVIEDGKTALQDSAKKAFAQEKERQISGGPLDRIGTLSDEPPKSGGWTSFMTRK